ncbi:MAG: 3-dehydroquinate synthase, partial [Candidatus Omnitrophica bacterium]|nr:3-dehydroquinate synthase [Candidatus Omnitrophota bacterium]
VIGDLSGFIASVYKRGVPYIQVPTTLLAQVDSAIGGKTALDLTEAKNMVGAIYQPRLVVSDISLLKTLDRRQVNSGLAEAVKYGIIKDKALFSYLEKHYRQACELKTRETEHVVSRCSRIKAAVVREDEREEKGIRTILNFGHTIGHALEAATGFNRLNHGEAIAVGMLASLEISAELGLIKQALVQRVEDLIRAIGLPVKAGKLPMQKVLDALQHDKKFKGRRNRFVLSSGIGKTLIKEGIGLAEIKKALKKRLG